MTDHPLRLGISRCLLGDAVRYDGGHKHDGFLTDVLGPYVEWIPVCPEVEAGLGVPREPMRLVSGTTSPRLMTVESGIDYTETVKRFSEQRVQALEALHLCGYVFKDHSPSCGMERVPMYNARGMPVRPGGVGVFARTFMAHFPLAPVEEEGRLKNPLIRDHFIERVFCYRRWKAVLYSDRLTQEELIPFHTRHKLLLLSHSRKHYDALEQLIGNAKQYRPVELARRYGTHFMNALKIAATPRTHVNVLQHVLGHFKTVLRQQEQEELLGVIEDYHHGIVPLMAPLTLITDYIHRFDVAHLKEQLYFEPFPKELKRRIEHCNN
jgi:uncharacterized protein YbgA (DUF1722 family)/uncharacterized protein YbbK (DUF523 family)